MCVASSVVTKVIYDRATRLIYSQVHANCWLLFAMLLLPAYVLMYSCMHAATWSVSMTGACRDRRRHTRSFAWLIGAYPSRRFGILFEYRVLSRGLMRARKSSVWLYGWVCYSSLCSLAQNLRFINLTLCDRCEWLVYTISRQTDNYVSFDDYMCLKWGKKMCARSWQITIRVGTTIIFTESDFSIVV